MSNVRRAMPISFLLAATTQVAPVVHVVVNVPTPKPDQTAVDMLTAARATVVASWWLVAVTAAIGIAGVTIAATQLTRFVNIERGKATVEYLDKYEEKLYQVHGNPDITASTGLMLISGIAKSPADLEIYKQSAPDGKQRQLSEEDQKGYDRYSGGLFIATNYFVIAAELIEQGILDGKLFVKILTRQILLLNDAIVALKDVEPIVAQTVDVPSFRTMIDAARKGARPSAPLQL